MRRIVAGILEISLFLFALSLPMLHLHPSAPHDHDAVIHAHMPQTAGAHEARKGNFSRNFEANDPSELRSVPIDICALCPTDQSPASDLTISALPAPVIRATPTPDPEYFTEPESKAQAPPGISIHFSLRSPPA